MKKYKKLLITIGLYTIILGCNLNTAYGFFPVADARKVEAKVETKCVGAYFGYSSDQEQITQQKKLELEIEQVKFQQQQKLYENSKVEEKKDQQDYSFFQKAKTFVSNFSFKVWRNKKENKK